MVSSAGMSLINRTFSEITELQSMYDENRIIEPLITKDLVKMSDALETSFKGLEFSVKSAPSVENKIERKIAKEQDLPLELRSTNTEHFLTFSDSIRYTEIAKPDEIFTKAMDTIDYLESKGYKLAEVKNYFEHPYDGTGYKGLHLNFICGCSIYLRY